MSRQKTDFTAFTSADVKLCEALSTRLSQQVKKCRDVEKSFGIPAGSFYGIHARSILPGRRMIGDRFLMLDTTPIAAYSVTMDEPP